MNNDFKPKRRKWTVLKFMVATVAVVTVIAAVVLPELAKPRGCRAQPISCVNNQKQLGIAFRGFGIDMGGFPMVVSADPNSPSASELGQLNSPVPNNISAR